MASKTFIALVLFQWLIQGSPIALPETLVQGMPKLVLYCSSTKECTDLNLQKYYPSLLSNISSEYSPKLYTVGLRLVKENLDPLSHYANLQALPYAFQFTEELLQGLKDKRFNHSLKIAVVNASVPAHQIFFKQLLDISQEDIGYIDIDTQFEFAFSFEVYRRHCPTLIQYNPLSGELWLTYEKFTGNATVDTPRIRDLLQNLNKGKVKSIKLGWTNLYTKFVNFNYIYNNFHFMFNYLVGGISITFILVLLIFEKRILRTMQQQRPARVPEVPKSPEGELKKVR